jgi:hypothetical protein
MLLLHVKSEKVSCLMTTKLIWSTTIPFFQNSPGLSGLEELGDGLYGIGLETVRDLMLPPDIAISL